MCFWKYTTGERRTKTKKLNIKNSSDVEQGNHLLSLVFVFQILITKSVTRRPKLDAIRALRLSLFLSLLRWRIPPMVVHPEKIDFRRFV